MTFNGNISIRQTGHAMVHLDKFNEDYLIPMPNAKVKGLLSGHLYPELYGTYHIISSTGFISEIKFSGKGFFSGQKNSFEAKMYRREDKLQNALYTVRGQWNESFVIHDCKNASDIETYASNLSEPALLEIPDLEKQDPWETRRAWKEVIKALYKGDLQATIAEKSKIEEAQRALRKREASEGVKWKPVFFSPAESEYLTFESLASAVGWNLDQEKTKGVWKVNREKVENAKAPYHGVVTPMG